MQKTEHTGAIEVEDENGNRMLVDEFTTFTQMRAVDGGIAWAAGSCKYEMDGEHCNPVGVDAFRTLHTERLLRRV